MLTLARRSGLERSWGVMLLIMLSKVLNCFSASFSCFSDIWFMPACTCVLQDHGEWKQYFPYAKQQVRRDKTLGLHTLNTSGSKEVRVELAGRRQDPA